MDKDEENFTTFLAYTKSPKTTKRTSFQDELKKAVNARVSRQKAIEEAESSDYSEEFESDDSLDDSFNETKAIKPESRRSFHDFHFSDDDDDDDNDKKSNNKVSFLKTRRQETKALDYEGNERTPPKSPIFGDMGNGRLIAKDQKPTPKPRESRMKRSPSPPGSVFSTLDGDFKPTPQDRNRDKTEGKHTMNKTVSVAAPSSLTRLNDKVSASETQSFSERHSPEGLRLSDSPSPTARLRSLPRTAVQKDMTITKEDASGVLKDLKIGDNDGHGNTELHVSEEGSPSVLEMMLTNVKEKSAQGENKDPRLSKTFEIFDSSEEDKMFGKHSQKLDLQKKTEEFLKLDRSQSSRSISAQQNKKSVKHRNSAKSRYMGTLTVLDKSVYENNGEIEAADTLRAAVYQNWLEKKKMFLREGHKMKMTEEEQKKEKLKMQNEMKKEEAMAAFMAWKSEKKKDIKEIRTKQKLEENKKLEELQDIARRKQDCRKAFEKWKESKEDHLKEKAFKEKNLEMEKKLKEKNMISEKKSNSMTAFKTWNERKELVLKEKTKEKKNEKLKVKKIISEKKEKEQMALDLYEEWLEKKEQQEKIEKKQRKMQIILDDEPPPPWSPPGRTIPAGR
ncbi:microtubule-associated protein 9 [Rana temporaria]|uniref:microtubule-associated protein 9 n=1 Tax=Rana temporaria TaxID=8407 RepID=UPI001AAD54FF|nr:microtubule-associated protein 9 [Rana temporaria]XP_040188070.1 microtubule-associated protein 9 [Rana temporaria]